MKNIRIRIIFLSAVFLLLISAIAVADETKVVKAEGRAIFSDYTTPAEAKAIALNNARRKALEDALGIPSRSDPVIYDSSVLDDLLNLATKSRISKEKILESRWDPLEDKRGMAWYTRIEATIVITDKEEQKILRVTEVSVMRPGHKEGDTLFHPGEKLQVKTKVSKRAYLQLFGIDQNGLVFRLFPVRLTGQKLISAGETFVFPTEHEMKFGIRIKVSLLKGQDSLVETVMAIATKEKGKLLSKEHIEYPTILDVMKELSSMSPSQWAVKTVSYEVR